MNIFADPTNCLWILAISVTVIALAKSWKRFRDKYQQKKANEGGN